jgi:hypothetical protein
MSSIARDASLPNCSEKQSGLKRGLAGSIRMFERLLPGTVHSRAIADAYYLQPTRFESIPDPPSELQPGQSGTLSRNDGLVGALDRRWMAAMMRMLASLRTKRGRERRSALRLCSRPLAAQNRR